MNSTRRFQRVPIDGQKDDCAASAARTKVIITGTNPSHMEFDHLTTFFFIAQTTANHQHELQSISLLYVRVEVFTGHRDQMSEASTSVISRNHITLGD